MKKRSILFAGLAALTLVAACGGDHQAAGAGNATEVKGETEISAVGTVAVDNEYFSMTLEPGWQAGPLTSGMVNVLPKGGKYSPGLYFKFEGNGNAAGSAEASIQSMIDRYGGAPMVDTVIAGVTFKTTTYTYGGSTQIMHVAFRDGTKVTITIEGRDAGDNPDIRAMLASLVLK